MGRVVSIYNYVIANLINFWLLAVEPLMLRIARNIRGQQKYSQNVKVSVIIATYNRANILINRTIPSVLRQTHKNIEVIVVGDCCIDDTQEKIKLVDDLRVKFFNLDKRGKYPSNIRNRWFVQGSVPRNFGMKVATGDWFVFISDDDIMYPHHIETMLNNAKKYNLEFASASYEAIKDGKKIVVNPEKNNRDSDLVCGGMQTWIYRSYLRIFKWNRHSWRKSYDRPVDYDLQQRFYRCGVRMGYFSDIVYFNPAVEGTSTSGYQAAIEAESALPVSTQNNK